LDRRTRKVARRKFPGEREEERDKGSHAQSKKYYGELDFETDIRKMRGGGWATWQTLKVLRKVHRRFK
jgi:hypothetical protein